MGWKRDVQTEKEKKEVIIISDEDEDEKKEVIIISDEDEDEKKEINNLGERKKEKIVARYNGIAVYDGDFATFDKNEWVVDTIVDVLLNCYCTEANIREGTQQYYPFPNNFQQLLLCNGLNGVISKRPQLTGYFTEKVQEDAPAKMWQYRHVFVPVCDM